MTGQHQPLKLKSLMWFRWILLLLIQNQSAWLVSVLTVTFNKTFSFPPSFHSISYCAYLEQNSGLFKVIDEIDGALGDGKGAVEIILQLVSYVIFELLLVAYICRIDCINYWKDLICVYQTTLSFRQADKSIR